MSFLELSRRLNQDGPDAELVEVVNKVTTALENGSDVGTALEALPELNNLLEGKMKEAAKKLDFEEEVDLRDRINNLQLKIARRS